MSTETVRRYPIVDAKTTKTSQAYETLKEQILSNALLPGTPLVERKLCEFLDVSRTPIREALQRLAHEELVTFIPGKLAHVSYITYESIVEVYDVREVLEGLAVRLFVENSDQEKIDALENILEQFHRLATDGDMDEAIQKDIEFHEYILWHSKNSKLMKMIKAVSAQSNRITIMTRYDPKRPESTYRQHKAVIEAVQQQDAALAESRMREHIQDSKRYHIMNINRYKFNTL
jgi:DNA-binding GntR family transcriptional regulator